MKDVDVIPVLKEEDKSKPGNYRPVSLTVVLCKIMESVTRDKVIQHIDRNDIYESVNMVSSRENPAAQMYFNFFLGMERYFRRRYTY